MAACMCGRQLVVTAHTMIKSCSAPILNLSQIRTTMVMKRIFDVPLTKLGETAHLKRLQFVYKPHNTLDKRIPDMAVVLTQYVEGIGDVGDLVTVRAYIARNELLLPGLAVYNTPENLEKYANMKLDRPRRTPFCLKTLRHLEEEILNIPMNVKEECEINKDHVRIAFRLAGVELTNDCIVLPGEPVLSSQMDEFTLEVVINSLFTAHVRARIYNYHLDASGKPVPSPPRHDNR